MNRFIYSLCFYLAIPLIIGRLLLRARKTPAYSRRWPERFGFLPRHELSGLKNCIWVHAVSVGESHAAEPLIKTLQQNYPHHKFVISSMTPTGSERVKSLFGDSVYHVYAAYDLPSAVKRFIKAIKPGLFIIMETELWPNTIHHCNKLNVPVLLANARLSEKSAKSYARFRNMTAIMLNQIDCIAAQSEADASRFKSLGMDESKISVCGSLKFNTETHIDRSLNEAKIFSSIKQSGRPVFIAASTREGEDEKLLTAFKLVANELPSALMILVPRHPQRFDSVANLCQKSGLTLLRRSEGLPVESRHQLVLGDSMGEMQAYYDAAEVAFVGGSLVDTGCQNVLEPAAMGLAVLVGPSQYNFATICQQLEAVHALKTIKDEQELAVEIVRLLQQKGEAIAMGVAARQLIAENQQALPKLTALVAQHFNPNLW